MLCNCSFFCTEKLKVLGKEYDFNIEIRVCDFCDKIKNIPSSGLIFKVSFDEETDKLSFEIRVIRNIKDGSIDAKKVVKSKIDNKEKEDITDNVGKSTFKSLGINEKCTIDVVTVSTVNDEYALCFLCTCCCTICCKFICDSISSCCSDN